MKGMPLDPAQLPRRELFPQDKFDRSLNEPFFLAVETIIETPQQDQIKTREPKGEKPHDPTIQPHLEKFAQIQPPPQVCKSVDQHGYLHNFFDFHGFLVRRNGAACTNTPPFFAPSGFTSDSLGAAVDGHIPIQGDSAGMGLIYRVSDFLGMFFLLFLSEKMKKK